MIPKIIHQTWKTETLPPWAIKLYNSWDTFNPGYTHYLWTDVDNRNFVKNKFPSFLDMYDNLPLTIQRVDAVRYLILYEYGGVYVDLDFECYKPLTPFLESNKSPIILSRSSNLNVVTNSIMMSAPRQRFWLDVAHSIRGAKPKAWYEPKSYYVLRSTGPLAVQRVYNKMKDQVNIRVLDKSMFFPFTMFQKERRHMSPPETAHGAHHHRCTWTNEHHTVTNAICFILIIIILFAGRHVVKSSR